MKKLKCDKCGKNIPFGSRIIRDLCGEAYHYECMMGLSDEQKITIENLKRFPEDKKISLG